MADPLSITASLIAILQLSKTVGRYLYGVRQASEESRKLLVEVTTISGLIYHLKSLDKDLGINRGEWSYTAQSLALPGGPLDQLKDALYSLSTRLPQGDQFRTRQALAWPFRKSEVKDTIERISRIKTYLILALQNDQLALNAAIHDNVEGMQHMI
ncbi:MAG: hypothetical protein Q9227_002778 [Pyrenula ochraceoflavens]